MVGAREMGLVETDQCSHVVVPNLTGTAALCGAGNITMRLPGFFDPTDPLACVLCAKLLLADELPRRESHPRG